MEQNPQLLKAFLKEEQEFGRARIIFFLFFAITLVPIFGILDYLTAPQYLSYFLTLRMLNTIGSIAILLLVYFYKNISLNLISIIVFILCLSPGLMIAYMSRLLGGYSSSYYVGIILVLVAVSSLIPWKVKNTALYCVSIFIGYVVIAYTPDYSWRVLANNSFFLVSTMSIAVAITYYSQRFRLKDFSRRQEILEKNQELRSLDQAKTRFFTNLTHEFRTPLVSLATLLQMIREKLTPDKDLSAFLQSGYASLTEMIENINDLLHKTKSEQGFLEMRWSKLDIVEMTRKSVDVFKVLASKDVELVFENQLQSQHGETLPDFLFYVDRFKYKKILNNLLGNALKFTQTGSIRVQLSKNEKYLILKVSDSGLGIPPDEIQTVFEPFTQASNNTLRDVKGTGLGLAIVKDFVAAHQGEVFLESELGQGSTFTIELPLGDQHVDKSKLDLSEVIEEDIDLSTVTHLKTAPSVDLSPIIHEGSSRYQLLIVEDTPQVAEALAYVLKDEYNLAFAQDGEEGFAKIQELKPDLIISDIMMPKKDGYELLHDLKQDPQLKTIPFVMLTAKIDLESRIKGLEFGADEYISKPFNNLEVKTRVKNLLERRRIEIEFIHAEKMVALGQLVAGISHEILNPIAYAKSAAANIPKFYYGEKDGSIPKDFAEENLEGAMRRAQEGIERVCSIVDALKGFVRQGYQGFDERDLHEALESTLKIVHINYKHKLSIHKEYGLNQKVVCNINQLNQVFLNLIVNALHAMAGQEKADLWLETSQQGENAMIVIRDSGPGIPKDIQEKVFNPFFTTKELDQGTGLGLYISQQIVHEHKGKLLMQSSQGIGTTFTIQIPIHGAGGENGSYSFTRRGLDKRVAQVKYPHR